MQRKKQILKSSSGQIVLEYILLVVVAVGLVTLISSTLVSRNAESPGYLIDKWHQILQTIGSDPSE